MNKRLIAGALAFAAISNPAHAAILWGVDETNTLHSFSSANPGVYLTSVTITGVGGASVLAMDYRVASGETYLLTDDSMLYAINRHSGVATFKSALALTGANFAFDFNPSNANLRIVSNDNSNYVYNFVTNALVPGTGVAYKPADANFGIDPDVTGAAYINNDNNPFTGTTLFVIDTRNDVLATQNPATGVLTTIGALGVNLGARSSFDFTSPIPNGNEGFVLNGSQLYSINTNTGALTSLGATASSLFGLTAAPPLPEPTTWAMMLAGFSLIGAAMRRRGIQTKFA